MNALGGRIARLIAAQGPLSVAQFMTIALHDPQAGTYAARDPLGARGDFITAPEICQIFGELMGLWCVQIWRDQGAPKKIRLVELGPGRGTLMADALRAAKLDRDFLAATEVVLVEASPTLRDIQRARLKDSPLPVRWSDRFDETLSDRPLLLLANEFFDALPVRQFVKTERGWCERMVIVEDGRLAFALAPAISHLDIAAGRGDADIGAVYELSPAASALGEEIARVVVSQGGGALIVDYGHNGTGFGETLQAVREHRFANILDEPGEADLSAHVDFASLARAAALGGAKAFGPVAQGAFLERLGVRARAENLERANPGEAARIADAVHRLVDPQKMGTLFKALAILPASALPPPGF
ncbi:MAG: SAM-dependent methyltransferase [Proteobacteria bacterium]|nr:SAM-dependent methyltransferase [Pseudomonadota bacterium]